jgi:renalase
MWDVVVVGAGLSGLVAARQLTQAGLNVVVVEKSRGLGGRLATRRVEGAVVDHGCRYFAESPTNPSPLIAELHSQGLLQPWTPAQFALDAASQLQRLNHGFDSGSGIPLSSKAESAAETAYYVCPQGMTTIAKTLAQGLTIQRQCRVIQLSRDGNAWVVQAEVVGDKSGEGAQPSTPMMFNARSVLLAVPAPQALAIVTPTLAELPSITDLTEALQKVEYEPVITVMAGYNDAQVENLHGLVSGNQGWMVFGNSTGPLRWVGLDSSKHPGVTPQVVVLHSSATFARDYLDTDDLKDAGLQLLQAAANGIDSRLDAPAWMQVHRWRYGFVHTPSQSGILCYPTDLPLVCCGDWRGSHNVGTAFKTGQQAATTLYQSLYSGNGAN